MCWHYWSCRTGPRLCPAQLGGPGGCSVACKIHKLTGGLGLSGDGARHDAQTGKARGSSRSQHVCSSSAERRSCASRLVTRHDRFRYHRKLPTGQSPLDGLRQPGTARHVNIRIRTLHMKIENGANLPPGLPIRITGGSGLSKRMRRRPTRCHREQENGDTQCPKTRPDSLLIRNLNS